ncbi:unnamed protein product [Urochloa humidicola]
MGEYAPAAVAVAPTTAKTSVWWDIDKCAVPRGRCDPHRIAHNLVTVLAAAGYAGPVSIAVYGDAARVPPPVLAALSATGICINHVPAGSKDTIEKRMLVDMLFWAFDNPPPGNYLLISGDQDLSDLLHRLRMKRYDILLVRPPNASSQAVAAAANKTWLWESFTAGEVLLPEPPPATSVLGCKLNVISSDTLKCSQSNACFEYGKGDGNAKAGNQNRMKPLQKYVKKTNSSSTPAINQDRVAQAARVSESSTESTSGELDHSCVTSLSSSSCESSEGAKVDVTVLLKNATSAKSSSHNLVLTECLRRNGTLGKGGNQNMVKPLQKYVKKTNSLSTPAINQDRVAEAARVSESSTGSTSSELDHSCVTSLSSSCSESSEGAKVDATVPLENAASAKSSSHKPVLTECLRRNATLGKGGNQNRMKPLQKYVKKTNSSSTLAINQDRVAEVARVSESSTGSTSGELDHSCVTSLSSSCSESSEGAKVDATVPLENAASAKSSSHKPVLTECLRRNATLGKGGNQNRMKPLQKYVKKTNSSSTPAINQDRVAEAARVSESSAGSTSGELDHSCVTSLSSSCSESSEGAKVDAIVPLENAVSAKSSSHKPVLTECLRRNATLGKGGNQNRMKHLQKHVKKANSSSTPAINQDRVAEAARVSESSTGSTSSELDHSCVTSLSSSCSESSEGAKVHATIPLENAASVKSSSHKPVLTECLRRNATLDFGASYGHYNQMSQHLIYFEAQNKLHPEFTTYGNKEEAVDQHGVMPFQKYVKKTTMTPRSVSKQLGSTGVLDCPKGSSTIEQDRAPVVSSSTSKLLEGSKAGRSGQPETPTLPYSSAQKPVDSAHLHQSRTLHESILGKKPSKSVEHASRNGTHDFHASTVHYHPAFQKAQSSETQNKLHSYSIMVHNSGKLSSENKFSQQKASVERINISSASASNEIDLTNKFIDYSKGSTLNHQSMSASSSSKSLESAKVNQSSLLLSAHKPVMINHLHQDGAAFAFGNGASTSFQRTVKIGTFVVGVSSGQYYPTYQQAQYSLLPEHNSDANPHIVHGHSHLENSHRGSSASSSVAHSGIVQLFVFLLRCLCCGSFIVSDEM